MQLCKQLMHLAVGPLGSSQGRQVNSNYLVFMRFKGLSGSLFLKKLIVIAMIY